ncbi:MAG: AtuA-related protein [Bryobacteraceae bacterium]
MKIRLSRIAHARSGDKGDVSNVGLIAYEPRHYKILAREVTADRVQAHFGPLVEGPVARYELPNLAALNFVMERALDGGGTFSLRTDAQGKTHGAALLAMEIEVEADELDG